ncbi:hypothetical protein X777_02851 [Ooceraea biroi]|uniref:Uncharacterized protein n=1 Tax=Ooceraea biroi TaxID=2015173 RepID=A0A026WJU4_OOCBI|nr:hypothetical protein X777_02851 [Ooceraea biroi]
MNERDPRVFFSLPNRDADSEEEEEEEKEEERERKRTERLCACVKRADTALTCSSLRQGHSNSCDIKHQRANSTPRAR